jgi:ADP-glucose pyrophosphorylase
MNRPSGLALVLAGGEGSRLGRVTRAIVDEEANVREDTVVGGNDEIAVVAGRLEDS